MLPQNISSGRRVQRVCIVVPALRERGKVVGRLQRTRVQVQRVLQKGRAGVTQMRAARPPPGRHGTQRRRRHHVAQRQRLLEDGAHLLLHKVKHTITKLENIYLIARKFKPRKVQIRILTTFFS